MRGEAVKLYAQAIRDYGQTRPPDVAGVARCLEKLPWVEADPREFKQLARDLAPLLEDRRRIPAFETWKRRIITKYRLLRGADEPDVAPADTGYDVPVVLVPALGVPSIGVALLDAPRMPIAIEKIPLLVPEGVQFVFVDADALEVELANIPENAVVLVRVDESVGNSIREWTAVNELRFRIMGEHGVCEPHKYSALGFHYEELRDRLERAGPSWRSDPALLADWEAYWRAVSTALDRRAQLRERYGRGR